MDLDFFTLSKLAWILINPGNLLILLLVSATLALWWGRKTLAKGIFTVLSIAGLVVWVYPVGDWLISPLEQRFKVPQTFDPPIDGIIVLGGGEDLRASLSWQQPQLGEGGDRYTTTRYLAALFPKVPIVFSGGSGSLQLQNTSGEGSFAKTVLMRLGIDHTRLKIESDSRNTYENFVKLRSLLPDPNGHYLVVTSAFHVPRVVGIARKLNIHVTPWPTDYRSGQGRFRKADFQFSDHLATLETAWREWVGLSVYFLTGRTQSWLPAPDPDPDPDPGDLSAPHKKHNSNAPDS